MKSRSALRITLRLLFFCAWLAVGLITVAMILPQLNRARMASRKIEVADGGVEFQFETTTPIAEPPSHSDGGSVVEEDADWGGLSGINGEVIGDSIGEGGQGLSGTGRGGGGYGNGTIGIGSLGAGASPRKTQSKSSKVASAKRAARAKPAGASSDRRDEEWPKDDDEVSELLRAEVPEPEGPGSREEVAESSAPDDSLSDVDRKLADLPLGNIAFNTPESIPLGDSARIELLVSLKEAEEQLRRAVRAEGPVESARVKISNQMEARLTGLGFRIEAITPERQAVTRGERTQWQWQIEPNRSATLELHLTLSALIEVDGVPATRAVRTFERTIYVEVPLVQRLTDFVADNLELLTTVILIPVAGGIWRHARKKKKQAAKLSADDAPPTKRAA